MILISNSKADKFITGNIHGDLKWTSNKELAWSFKSEAEAVQFEEHNEEFIGDELTLLVDYKTGLNIYSIEEIRVK